MAIPSILKAGFSTGIGVEAEPSLLGNFAAINSQLLYNMNESYGEEINMVFQTKTSRIWFKEDIKWPKLRTASIVCHS